MTPQEIWEASYRQLELQLDRASFITWLRGASLLDYVAHDHLFIVGVQNSYAQETLQTRLYRHICRVLSDVSGRSAQASFEVSKAKPAPLFRMDDAPDSDMPLFKFMAQNVPQDFPKTLSEAIISPRSADLPEAADLNPRFNFERFVVSKSNQLAYEAARAVADYPGTNYNPFLVYGGSGTGKTHILQSIAAACAARGLRVLYLSSEMFVNDLVSAISNRTTALFRDKYRSLDVLLVDDIHFISDKASTQEEFFHTFNALVNFNKQVVLSSDRHPSELRLLQERLRTRFQGGLVTDLGTPEFELRLAILQMWAQENDVHLPQDVLNRLAQEPTPSIREMGGMFNHLVAQARLMGGVISLPRAENTLRRFDAPRDRPNLERIIAATAEEYHLMPEDLCGKRRTADINEARQVAMYLARALTQFSLIQIGESMGGRTHTTVLHGCNKIEEDLRRDRRLEGRVQRIKHSLKI